MAPDRLLSESDLATIHGIRLSRRTLYREEAAGRFPARVRPTKKTHGWRESEIIAWLEVKNSSRAPAAITSTLDDESVTAIAEMRRRQSIQCP